MSLACPFCNQRCRYVQSSRRDEYYCNSCNVDYQGPEDYLACMKFRTMIKEIRYELLIDTQNNKTKLGYWDEYKGYSPTGGEPDIFKVLVETDSAMKGITPENVEDKIKTLLMFS